MHLYLCCCIAFSRHFRMLSPRLLGLIWQLCQTALSLVLLPALTTLWKTTQKMMGKFPQKTKAMKATMPSPHMLGLHQAAPSRALEILRKLLLILILTIANWHPKYHKAGSVASHDRPFNHSRCTSFNRSLYNHSRLCWIGPLFPALLQPPNSPSLTRCSFAYHCG